MITFTLIAILGVLLVVVLMQLNKKPAAPVAAPRTAGPPPLDLANLTVADARPGDAISISGAGDEMSDLDFTADRLTHIEAGARRWSEIAGPYRERRVTLRVSGDDQTEVALDSGGSKPTLEDLGVSEDDLAQMDERQNTADNFGFDNANWFYRLSREARSWRDGSQPVGFYYWEFHEENGKRLLEVRKAEGEPFAVAMYTGIPAADVTIYRGRS
jgi:hypothetical protein